jgi:PAS domain S-box-containing protein
MGVPNMSEQKKVQNELDSGENILSHYSKAIIDTSIDGFCLVNTDGVFVEVNESYCKMLGYSRQEFIGMKIRDIDALETEEQTAKRIEYVMNAGYDRFETKQRCKDGRIIDVEVSTQFCETEKGKIFFSFYRDITEHKKAEMALKDSERRYKTLFDNASEGIIVVEIGTRKILYANPCACKMLEYTEEQMKQISVEKLHSPNEWEHVYSEFLKQKEGVKKVSLDIPYLRKDGKTIYADLTFAYVDIDKKKCWVAFLAETTERKIAETALRESEQKYKTLFENAVEGILVADIETKKFIYANPGICKMLGYTEKELTNMHLKDIHSADDWEFVKADFEALAKGQKSLSTYIPCLKKDGTTIFVDINTSRINIDGKECNVGFFTDITEYKRIKNQLENYREKVQQAQKNAYISSLGTIVAHQINQPLTKINILLDRAIDELTGQSCCPSAIKNLSEGAAEVKNITSIIQNFRKHPKGRFFETEGTAIIAKVADRITTMLSDKLKRTKMRISTKKLDNLEVPISEVALEQIFLIIVQNAIEAASGKEKYNIDIDAKTTDGKIELLFKDNCCGIEPQNLEKIFDPFFSTKPKEQGMGLGLSIVQQILMSCSGQIRAESQPGKGTTFYVTFPVIDNVRK